jgi:hypothetical protein
VDRDEDACDLASRLIARRGLSDRIEVACRAAESTPLRACDLVICASLLDAPQIYQILAKNHVRTFLIRNAQDLFRLCYRKAPPPPEIYRLARVTEVSPLRINISCLCTLT